MFEQLMANSFASRATRTFSWVSRNVPVLGSSVNITTPRPNVSTSCVCGPYMQYPAATWLRPDMRKSSSAATRFGRTAGSTEKIEPIDTLMSMLLEPSSGSKQMR